MHLQEVAVVDDGVDDLTDVVGLGGVLGNDRGQVITAALRVVHRLRKGRILHVVGRDEGEQAAHFGQAVLFTLDGEVGDAALGGVDLGPAQLLVGDLVLGDGADDLRTGDVHLRRTSSHEGEVGDGWGVDGATGARPHDDRNLGYHP